MNSSLMRVFWSLLVHAGVLLLTFGLIYFIGGDQGVLAEATRSRYADRPAMLEQIRSDAIWQLINWGVLSLAASWVLSSIWLVVAERQRPTTPLEGASKQGLWVMMLILSLIAMAFIGWSVVWKKSIQLDLAASMITSAMVIVGIATFLAYFLATAMSVKTVMRPSVPYSALLPSFSKVKP